MILPSTAIVIRAIVCATCVVHFTQEGNSNLSEAFSTSQGFSIRRMISSMFLHQSPEHLMSNMIPLFFSANGAFVNSSSFIWNNCISFLFIYFGSGIAGYELNIILSKYFQKKWNERVLAAKESVSFKSWLLKNTLNPIIRPIASAYLHVTSFKDVASMHVNANIRRVGASGGVYGIIAADLITNFLPRFHTRPKYSFGTIMSCSLILYDILGEVSHIPYNFQSLSKVTFSGDNIDHAAHVGGFIFGAVSSIVLYYIAILTHEKKRGITL